MDQKKLNTAMTVLKIVLATIGVFACVWVLSTGPNPETVSDADLEKYREGAEMGLAINYTIIIMFVAAAAVLLFFLFQLITNPKKTVMSIIGILAALLVYLILYLSGSSDTVSTLALDDKTAAAVSESTIPQVSAGLWTAIIGVAIAVGAWILSPVLGRYRK